MRVKVKFWGQNEDYSPGDSVSNSSEKLLQRGQGEGQCICESGDGEIHAIKHIFFQISASLMKLSASPEKQSSP